MKLGLIGNPLTHSWSPEIHKFMLGADYSLWPLEPSELEGFLIARDFDGINVTVPYKSEVIKYLDEVDSSVAEIGAVNTILNNGGKLTGHNTDAYGLAALLDNRGMNQSGGPAAILGTGGASKAAKYVCSEKGWDYDLVSRNANAAGKSCERNGDAFRKSYEESKSEKIISYDDLYENSERYSIIINTTPAGMHPALDDMPVDPGRLSPGTDIADIIANPVRSRLVTEARKIGLKAEGGLEMLVAQALRSDELFTGIKLDYSLVDKCIASLQTKKCNIVLIGMPSAGKTSVAEILAESLGMKMIDSDDEIEKRIGCSIKDYFASHGEEAFRDMESEVCADLSLQNGCVIATGGGVVKHEGNMRRLSETGIVVWLDRDLSLLEATDSRPLSSNSGDLMMLYEERMPLYEKYSDIKIDCNGAPEEAAESIENALKSRII